MKRVQVSNSCNFQFQTKKSPTSSQPYDPLQAIARPTPSARVAPMVRSNGPPPPRPPPPTRTSPTSSFELSSSTSTSSYDSSSFTTLGSASSKTIGNVRQTLPEHSPRTSSFSSSFVSNFSQSRYNPRYEDMGPGQKAVAVQSEVFGVTDEECQSALKMNQWNVPNTIRYLKVCKLS